MKKLPCSLLGIGLLALGAAVSAAPKPAVAAKPATATAAAAAPASPAATGTATQRVTVPLSDPARPGTLHVNLIQGSIVVKGTSRTDLLIEVRPRVRNRAEHEDDDERDDDRGDEKSSHATTGLRQISQPLAFTVEEENNRVELSSNDPRRACDMVIEVPARTDLDLSTINDGKIQVDGVDGEHEISNVNGAITLARIGGSVVAHTTNGAVHVTFTRVTPNKPMAFTTLNGAVDVSLPPTTRANLRLRSDQGQLFTDFDFTQQAVELKESKEPNGRTMREIGKVIGGSINGGGPEFELRSFNGNVYVRKAGS